MTITIFHEFAIGEYLDAIASSIVTMILQPTKNVNTMVVRIESHLDQQRCQ